MKPDRSEYQELRKNDGVENYEVIEIYDARFEIIEHLIDSTSEQLIVYGKSNPVLEKDYQSKRKKISLLGNVLMTELRMR